MLNLLVVVDGCDELEILSCELAKQQEFFKLYTYKLPSQFVLHTLDYTKQVLRVIPSLLHKNFIGL